jgi:predicted regulator of Ras-like GTPase activity (Roadblock/LC7/MglB family)
MVDNAKIEQIVSDTMAANADIQGIVVCDAKGDVIFGHTLSESVNHDDVAKLVVQISGNSSKLTAGIDMGGLKELTIAAEQGYIFIYGDVKMVLAGLAGESAREQAGLIRMALKRALVAMVE